MSGEKIAQSRKILFVKLIEQGALVLHRPAFAKAAESYGCENIFICTFSANISLIQALKVIPDENIFPINENSVSGFVISFLKQLYAIRKRGIDTVIDLEFFSRATSVFCYMTGAVNRVGYHRYKGFQTYRGNLFTHRHNYSHYVHVADSSMMMLQSLQQPITTLPALVLEKSYSVPYLYQPTEQKIIRIKMQLLSKVGNIGKLVVVNPNFNDILPLRQWSPNNYLAVCKGITAQIPNVCFVFTGRKDEYTVTAEFILKGGIKNAINWCGETSITDLLALYSYAHLLICSDSGPGHFASMTNIQSIVLFGPETPELYGPKSPNTHVIYKSLSCSPCYNVYNNRLSGCSNNLCLQTIKAEEVINLAVQLLKK